MLFKHIFIFAIRKLQQDKLQTILNIVGLVIGISSFLFILLIVSYEHSFNKFQPGYDRIFRVYSKFEGVLNGVNRGAPTAIYSKIKEEFTGVESLTNFQTFNCTVNIPVKNAASKDFDIHNKIIFARPDYFSVFEHYEWVIGNPETSLSQPFQVVLTESRANTYFGKTDAVDIIGREIHYNDSLHVIVSGIVKDGNKRTDFDFTEFISFNSIEKSWLKNILQPDSWNSVNSSSQLFIKLSPNTSVTKIKAQLPLLGEMFKKKHKNEWNNFLQLQPLEDLHFNSTLGVFDYSRSIVAKSTLQVLTGVATLILLIALLNNVNLSIAHNLKRAKEVWIRKVMGSSNRKIILQFICESLFHTIISIILSIGLVWLIIQNFTLFVPQGLEFNIGSPFIIITLGTIALVISLFSGLSPALVLFSNSPRFSLRNLMDINISSIWSTIRVWLTAFQIASSQVLLFFSTVIMLQIYFMLNMDIGFTYNSVILFYTPKMDNIEKSILFKNELSKIPEIEFVSMGSPPNSKHPSSTSEFNNGASVLLNMVSRISADTSFLKLYNIQLLAGRNLLGNEPSNECLINETYLHLLGFNSPIDILGESIDGTHRIVGVVKDFNTRNLYSVVGPVVISGGSGNCIGVRLRDDSSGEYNVDSAKKKSKDAWRSIYPEAKIDYRFLDEIIADSYKDEVRAQYIAGIATIIAIFISCLGLYGLTAFSIIKRTKEIGVRKVLGGTISNILILLLKDSLRIVLIAFVVAMPIAYYFGEEWLERFAYRINLSYWIFLLTGIISLGTAMITIIWRVIKAAKINPANLLRYE